MGHSTVPSKPGFGDASSNAAFLLAKGAGRPPAGIAGEVAAAYGGGRLVSSCTAHPSGYVNLAADWSVLGREILEESAAPGYGGSPAGAGRQVIVEHTSVNPNKALHIGHVRNVAVGDSVSRILGKAGYDVRVLNYVDDSGLQVADIVLGFRLLGIPEEPPDGKKFDHYCGDDVYARATAAYESDPSLEEKRREVLAGMEEAGSEVARFASRITGRVLRCQLQTCWMLGAEYDCLNYESQIVGSGLWGSLFERMKGEGLARLEDGGKNVGCWVVPGPDGEDDKVLVRSNGTATYIAKDIPYAAWKLGLAGDPFGYAEYGGQPGTRRLWQTVLGGGGTMPPPSPSRVITVIDSRQARLQGIISGIVEGFGAGPGSYVHLGYESVALSPGTARDLGVDTGGKSAQMSGRKGVYVSADAVHGALSARISEETRQRHSGMGDEEVARIAADVATGVMRYEMIRQDLDKVIVFDMERSKGLEGDTAPYIQYAHARAVRLLEKAGREPPASVDCSRLGAAELDLVREIGMFGIRVGDAADNLSPKVVARCCRDLAVLFNAFYEKTRVLGSGDADLEDARLRIVDSFRRTVSEGLALLGIRSPPVM
ncbi:MAG: arginine--tRNA ligase [Nitrosopumilus sp.]|nr:arginine--tRNA ligase [Nitrosopumilus sp.]MDA7957819.1 arginine--tRNA ligase [Nitrosopumilus sp.]